MSPPPREYLRHMLDETDYVGVDYTIVWDVATHKLPDLRAKLQRLLDLMNESPQ